MTATMLPFTLDRSLTIRATPDTVFGFFTDDARWASWWGAGSTIEPRPGGRVYIRYANGTEAGGEVLEISSPHRLVFSFGYASGTPMPIGSSRVTIQLEPADAGTRLTLTHELETEAVRDEHVQGWRYQLSVFANVVADAANAGADAAVDTWFRAWSITEAREREEALRSIAEDGVRVADRFSAIAGLAELVPHIGAAQHFMPGMRLERSGAVRHCQGVVLADWAAVSPDGQPRGAGINVFTFNAAGRIDSVTGFWN